MMTYLQGVLKAYGLLPLTEDAFVMVEVNGVGYQALTSQRALGQMAHHPVESPIQLYTHMVVRPEQWTLVGFPTHEERDLFVLLQGASGVGVKVALAILSALSVSEIAQAIVSQNHKALTAAKGVGPRLAQKLILDLKEKLTAWQKTAPARQRLNPSGQLGHTLPGSDSESAAGFNWPRTPAYQDAEAVLLSLGYSEAEVWDSFQQSLATNPVEGAVDAETVLKTALQWLATR
ncbi:MAG: Holliday junction branch migration protein RuvA [Candidatus Melainabacteria bacterium]|nr:Holliday junction branch migration protein RuvA [Candidatus Melainabacteria bacterium]